MNTSAFEEIDIKVIKSNHQSWADYPSAKNFCWTWFCPLLFLQNTFAVWLSRFFSNPVRRRWDPNAYYEQSRGKRSMLTLVYSCKSCLDYRSNRYRGLTLTSRITTMVCILQCRDWDNRHHSRNICYTKIQYKWRFQENNLRQCIFLHSFFYSKRVFNTLCFR